MELAHTSASLVVADGQPQAARNADQTSRPSAAKAAKEGLSVRGSLALAFACVLAGVLIIGGFSLVQMGRLNASTQAIY